MKLLLSEILNERNISVNQLHKLTGISRTTLDPLSKTSELPSKTRFETIERIAKTLDVPVNEIIQFDSEIHESPLFEVEVLNVPRAKNSYFESSFDPFTQEYLDRHILKVINGYHHYLLVLVVRYSPGGKFNKKFQREIERLDYLLDFTRDSLDDEETHYDKEYKEIYNFLSTEGQNYKDDCVFSANHSFSLGDISHFKGEIFDLPNHYDLLKKSRPFAGIIGNDDFINKLSTYIVELYQLKKQKIQKILAPWELPKGTVPNDENTTIKTNYIKINYFSETKNIKKHVTHTIFLNNE